MSEAIESSAIGMIMQPTTDRDAAKSRQISAAENLTFFSISRIPFSGKIFVNHVPESLRGQIPRAKFDIGNIEANANQK